MGDIPTLLGFSMKNRLKWDIPVLKLCFCAAMGPYRLPRAIKASSDIALRGGKASESALCAS